MKRRNIFFRLSLLSLLPTFILHLHRPHFRSNAIYKRCISLLYYCVIHEPNTDAEIRRRTIHAITVNTVDDRRPTPPHIARLALDSVIETFAKDTAIALGIALVCFLLSFAGFLLYLVWCLDFNTRLALVSFFALMTILFSPSRSFADAHPRYTTLLGYSLVAHIGAWLFCVELHPVFTALLVPIPVILAFVLLQGPMN